MGQAMTGTTTTAIDTTTPVVEQETTNLRALDALFRASALAAYCHAVVSLPWSSYQEAQEAKVELLAWLDEIEESVNDATYQALRSLRVAVAAQLDTVARSLPFMRTYSPRIETCALLIALELYGDARRESEIVARNNLRDPSHVKPSDVLEVASA
jgi:prophage DNA circulation protein